MHQDRTQGEDRRALTVYPKHNVVNLNVVVIWEHFATLYYAFHAVLSILGVLRHLRGCPSARQYVIYLHIYVCNVT